MRIDNPSISGSLSFIGGTNSISPTSASLTGSFSGTFEGGFSSTAVTSISGAFDSVSQSLASDISLNRSSINSLNSASSSYLLNTTDTLDGDLTVTGKITAQEFHTEFVSASIIYQSGSTKFGDSADDTHVFTGNVGINDSVSGNFATNYDTKLLVGGEIIARSLTANESMVSIGGDSSGAFIKSGKQDGSLTDRPLNLITGEDIRLSIDSNGNVGIGTNSPAYKLDVRGTGGELLRLTDTDGTFTGLTLYTGGSNVDSRNWGIYSNGYGFGDFNIVSSTSNSGSIDIINATRFTITKDGTVGIGTTVPSGEFHIRTSNSDARIVLQSSDGDESAILFGDHSDTIRTAIVSDNATNTLHFRGYNNANRMAIDSNGNVGIGSTSPESKLTVNGNILSPWKNTGTHEIGIAQRATNTYTNIKSTLVFRGADAISGGQAMAGGDVLIRGGIGVVNPGIGVYAGDVTIAGGEAVQGGSSGTGIIKLETGAEERLRIQSNGSIGIGTDSPSTILDVNGFIRARNGISTDNSAKSYTYRISNTSGSGTVWTRIGRFTGGQSNRIKIVLTGQPGYSNNSSFGGMATIIAQFNNADNLQGNFFQEGRNTTIYGVNFEQISGTDYYINIQLGSFSEYAIEVAISGGTYTPGVTSATAGTSANVGSVKNLFNNVFIPNHSFGVGTTSSPFSENGTIAFGGSGGIVGKSASVGVGGSLDMTLNAGGGGYQGFLVVTQLLDGNAAIRTHKTYSVFGRGTDSSIQQIASDNGSTGGSAFSVTTPSNGVLRVTNSSSFNVVIWMQFFGGASG